jgi:hypothetical protein
MNVRFWHKADVHIYSLHGKINCQLVCGTNQGFFKSKFLQITTTISDLAEVGVYVKDNPTLCPYNIYSLCCYWYF